MNRHKEYYCPDSHRKSNVATMEVLDIIMKSDIRKKLDDVDYEKKVINDIVISDIPDFLKVKLLDYLVAKKDRLKAKQVAEIAYEFFGAESLLEDVASASDIAEWRQTIVDKLQPSVKDFDEREITSLLALLVHEHYLTHKTYEPIYRSYMEYVEKNMI